MYNNNTKRICQYKLIKYISTIALTSLQEDNTIKQISTIVDMFGKKMNLCLSNLNNFCHRYIKIPAKTDIH